MSTQPCTVGLTGGLASGKSTVAAGLERLGAKIFDCDAYVHELYRPVGAGAADLAFLFGESVIAADGGVDREKLAALVIEDAAARSRLEGAIHPLVRSGVSTWLQTLESRSIAVVEAALLVETGSWKSYDLLAVVWCEPHQQIERAVARGMTPGLARGLIAAQLPLADKRALAHTVIDNSKGRAELVAEVERAWEEIVTGCVQRGAD